MDLKIAGKRALVLGGNRGMGLAIAKGLAGEGVSVLLAARDEQALVLKPAPKSARLAPCRGSVGDTKPCGLAAAVGDIDILINNTGGPPYGGVIGPRSWIGGKLPVHVHVGDPPDGSLPARHAPQGLGRIVTVVSTGAVQPIPVLGISNTIPFAPADRLVQVIGAGSCQGWCDGQRADAGPRRDRTCCHDG